MIDAPPSRPTLVAAPTVENDALLQRIETLPAKRSNAALVLRVCDDPSSGATELGAAVLSDTFLTAKLLKLANSAYFGLSREIRDPAGAVSVLGFGTVRALALAQVAGAMGDDATVPESFWAHSARAGAACSLLAPHFGVSGGEAFAIGLLHDIGRAVLADLGVSVDFSGDEAAEDPADEAKRFGLDHATVGRHLCGVMSLPDSFAVAIGGHHEPVTADEPAQRRLLAVALSLVDRADDADLSDDPVLVELGISAEVAQSTVLALDSQAAHLVSVLC